jgi:hypothetical protein
MCPAGDIQQVVELRDKNNDAMANWPVHMVFTQACEAMINWCEGQPHPVITQITDAEGIAIFRIRAGGCCVDGYPAPCDNDAGGVNTVVIEADELGILNAYSGVGSPDMHSEENIGEPWGRGDGDVDLNDFVRFSSVFLTDCACGDLHWCDNDIDLNDFVAFSGHFLHTCE